MFFYKSKIENFLKEKEIIFSTIVFLVSIFFWDIKINQIFQSKFLITILLLYFFLNLKKNEAFKILIVNFLIIFFLFLHSIYFVNYNVEYYFIFSLVFLFISNLVAYSLNKNFELILKKSCLYFILFFNLIFLYDLIFSNFYIYDHNDQHNGMCRIFHTENKTLLNFFFIENSHIAMTSNGIVVYLLLNFSKLSNFYKINLIFFISSILLFLGSLTLYLGLFLSVLFIMPLLFKNRSRSLIILFLINLLIIINFNNCNIRITQIFESDKIFTNKDNVVVSFNNFLSLDSLEEKISEKKIKDKNKKRAFDEYGNIKHGVNISTVVYLNHINFVVENLKENLFGIGFQNYEEFARKYAKNNNLIENYETQALVNINDGASNLNKLLVEFGYLNIIFGFLFFYCLYKNDYSFPVNCFIFTLVLTQAIRGAGYFNGGFIFIIFILMSSILSKKIK